ncbi:host specificity factor TipJ family phage tail protein [Stenotrophomonas sp. SMYL8]|uniref:host specificity factor TipJ family phage tail protein n=1 Tax=Stenotrophomonas sp. SMYL8 TaxID=3076041 RepID=UPI002E7676E7|nr:host specificity factor TipJ family phage tail protein [Stenotrophomonas sp. SMYL8]
MIRVFPSRMPGEALETHQHGRMTVDGWLRANVRGYTGEGEQPIELEVDGAPVAPEAWAATWIDDGSDVRIYPVPHYEGIAAVIYWVVVAVVAAYAIYMANNLPGSRNGQGDSLSLDTARANTARLGSPVREVLGRCRVWADYLVQPVSRFVGEKSYRTHMFVCVGKGRHIIPVGSARLGNTPISSFGSDVQMTIYPPGADVSGDVRSENWVNSTEVGATASGTAGLDLSDTADVSTGINADSVTVSGNVITLNNATVTDANGNERPTSSVPSSWVVGAVLTLKVAASFTATTSGLYSIIAGSAVAELAPYVGMPVLLTYNGADYALFVASYVPGSPAVPGVGGSAARVTGSAAASNFDFSGSPVTFGISWRGTTYSVALVANYITLGVLLTAINDQLVDSGLVATQSGGVVTVAEAASPFAGGSITYSGLPASVFGSSPTSTAGVATSGGTPATQPRVTLAYDGPAGTAFGGLPPGVVSLAMSRGQSDYRIAAVAGLTLAVERLTEAGVVDTSWPGWTNRTATDYSATGFQEGEEWLGPFLVCPNGETTDAFEYDFNFPGGLIWYTSKGNKRTFTVSIRVGYRVYGSGAPWTVRTHTYTGYSEDAVGFTERITLGVPGQVEVRVRRVTERGGNSARDACYWQGLRARLSQRPTRYDDLTTIGLTVTTGTKLAAQTDRRFNVEATRLYDQGTARSISGAMIHVMRSLGLPADQIDMDTLQHLEDTYWTPRGEFFDFSAEKSGTSALDMLQMAAQAGMGYFLLIDSMCSAGREGVKGWRGGISPQRQLEPLSTSFISPGPDDYDGVDVTYIDEVTWAAETVECRLPGVTEPWKVESYELQGVGTRDRAYRIGMRRLMKHQGQRLTYKTKTEMMGLVYQYGDRVKLFDDIPGSSTTSTMIESARLEGTRLLIEVGEYLDWSLPAPRCLVRFQDGTLSNVIVPTRVDDHRLTIAASALPGEHAFNTWIMDDPTIDPPELIFCDSSRAGYDAVLADLTPGEDGSVELTALQYDPAFYQYDDATAP